ncbi:MAG TPA: YbgA family protein [Nitrosarchaeum sp.]|nr:YbgA family protein [Nitrosarchaeum sp.]
MKDNHANFEKRNQIKEKDVIEYVLQRFDDAKCSNKIQNLVKFQTLNKYMLMAHDQTMLKKLGNIVASYKKIPFLELWEEYEKCLKNTMKKEPTIKTHTNVIMHIFGYFSNSLSQNEKQLFFRLIEEFRNNRISIGGILLEINLITYRFDNMYLASQTYILLYSDVQSRIIFQPTNKNNI